MENHINLNNLSIYLWKKIMKICKYILIYSGIFHFHMWVYINFICVAYLIITFTFFHHQGERDSLYNLIITFYSFPSPGWVYINFICVAYLIITFTFFHHQDERDSLYNLIITFYSFPPPRWGSFVVSSDSNILHFSTARVREIW